MIEYYKTDSSSISYRQAIEIDIRNIWNRLMHIRKRFIGEAYNELNGYIDRIDKINVGNIRDKKKYTDIKELYEVINKEIDRVDTLYFTQKLFFVIIKNYIFRIEEASTGKKKKRRICREFCNLQQSTKQNNQTNKVNSVQMNKVNPAKTNNILLDELRQCWKIFSELFYQSADKFYYGIPEYTFAEWTDIFDDISDKLKSNSLESNLRESLDIVKNNIQLLESCSENTLEFYERIMDDISRIY